MRRALPAGLVAVALLSASFGAHAQTTGDGVYGRFDGDLELRAQAGAAFASGGPGLAAQVSALYFATAGIYVHYTDACGSGAPRVLHSIATGIHLEPLFLMRGGVNGERGPAVWDLFIDSLAFELGAVWSAPRGASWDERPGMEAALSLALPFVPRATGPFLGLRGALRWRPVDFAPGPPSTIADRGAVLSLTLGWRQILRTHLIDAGDRVVR